MKNICTMCLHVCQSHYELIVLFLSIQAFLPFLGFVFRKEFGKFVTVVPLPLQAPETHLATTALEDEMMLLCLPVFS
jgi:hypothetical protein